MKQKVKNIKELSEIIHIPYDFLIYILNKPKKEYYEKFFIPKKNGSLREILAPTEELKRIQRRINSYLSKCYIPNKNVYGFIKKSSHIKNAQCHIKSNYLLNIDLKDFFSSIVKKDVINAIIEMGFNLEIANAISELCCYNDCLPQGAPTSPLLSNLVCKKLDFELNELAKKFNYTYSRYADDITFSSKQPFKQSLLIIKNKQIIIGKELSQIISDNYFSINETKIKYQSYSQHQEVTGLTVNEFANLPRNYIKNLRAILHNCQKNGMYSECLKYRRKNHIKSQLSKRPYKKSKNLFIIWFYTVLKGKIEYIKQIRGENNGYYIQFSYELAERIIHEYIIQTQNKNKEYADPLIFKLNKIVLKENIIRKKYQKVQTFFYASKKQKTEKTNKILLFCVVWLIILILNQVIFFHSTFKLYALKAALPHTCIISVIITYFIIKNKKP